VGRTCPCDGLKPERASAAMVTELSELLALLSYQALDRFKLADGLPKGAEFQRRFSQTGRLVDTKAPLP